VIRQLCSGQPKRRLKWTHTLGIEWAYRLVTEPRRMWRRNVNSFVFLGRVLRQCMVSIAGKREHVPGESR